MIQIIQKNFIWNDIRHIEMVLELADMYGLQNHPFREALMRLKVKYGEDLIANEEKVSP